MVSKEVIVNNKIGLHARPAALFVQTASKFLSKISIEKDGKKINGKSIMGVMALGVCQGDTIIIAASGEDEKKAVDDLENLLINKLEEEYI
ncbi:HPr family phosphocarrier protein [Clostridium sp. D2Q-14]|uniref:HPr family phosphocarrier protein n=1 Tax=Anaeromonas gelatinilytica TaxID=2683194 RepID=UPI00193BAD32|nr:HPr family phosphocarrier protein [Anaeromonas gelatinilytica]MBS4534791.1 HPr family phosphocarrier protein [Anaeromonas gelatinilytica]